MHNPAISRPRRWAVTSIAVLALLTGPLLAVTAPPESAAAVSPQSCDIFATGGTPCVGAFSSTRALFASYNGPLYQVRRASDGQTLNIGLLSVGGSANGAAQQTFCAGTTCTSQPRSTSMRRIFSFTP